MLTAITSLDATITNWIFNLPHPLILKYFFGFFAVKGVTLAIWSAIFVYLIFFEARHKRFIIYFLLVLAVAAFTYTSLKQIGKRSRPLSQIKNEKLKMKNYPSDYSFPSGHATISFAAAAVLSVFDKKRKKYFYFIASLIAFSRVYLGYHYTLDVVAGAFLGSFISHGLMIKLKRKNEKGKTINKK